MVTRLLTLLSLLTLIGGLHLHAAEETYDLRGPAPKKGLVTADVVKFTMNKADISIDLGDNKKLTGKMDMTSITEKEEEVLAVEGRQITKMRTKILKDDSVRKSTINGEKQVEKDKKALAGEIVFSELTKKGWKHTLEDTTPSDKQKKELKDFEDPESDDELYPVEKVKVGHEWNIEAKALKRVLGSKMTDAKGSGKGKFVRIEKLDGEPCAVIEMEVDIKGKIKQDDEDLTAELKGKIIAFRSIADAIDLKFTIDGSARYEGDSEEDGMKIHMIFAGKLLGEGTTKVKKK